MTFTERALAPVQRYGLSVIPCKPRSKAPLAPNGAKSRVNTEDGVLHFAANVPEDANYGICSDENFTVLETDDRAELIKLLGQAMPATLCVSARPNRGYWVFAQTPRSRAVAKSPKLGGVFEWRHTNQYCVGFGSIHPDTGAEYKLMADLAPVPMPDWLVDKLLELAKAKKEEAPLAPVEDKGNFTYDNVEEMLTALRDRNSVFVFEEGKPSVGRGWKVRCWNADEHTTGVDLDGSTVVWVNARGFADAHCSHSHCDYGWKDFVANWKVSDLQEKITKPWAMSMGSVQWTRSPNQLENLSAAGQSHIETSMTEEGCPPYPLEVWDGTDYADFAERATRGNFIPREFFIEALKTYTGAVSGANMHIDGLDGGNARFYTIMLAGPGKGKNTVIDWTQNFFKAEGLYTQGAWPTNALVWYAQHKIEARQWKAIGVCRAKVSSASGLARCLPRLDDKGVVKNSPQERILVVYSELAEVFEKFGIEGSGGAMMSAFCDLYDTEDFTVPALADLDSFGGRLQFSMLAGIQPRKWDIVCAGKGIEGSGLDERFNLIPTTDTRTVASLNQPDWTGLKTPFLERIAELDTTPYAPAATKEAIALAEEAHQAMQPDPNDDSAPSSGRLNILAWRNALHMAWLGRKNAVDADCMDRALKISRYQLAVRRVYKPLTGDNATARAANAIQRFMQKHSVGADVKLRTLERAVHADRMGPIFDAGLSHLNSRGRTVTHEQKTVANGREYITRYVRRME